MPQQNKNNQRNVFFCRIPTFLYVKATSVSGSSQIQTGQKTNARGRRWAWET